MWRNPQETTDLVTFTEEILNWKLHFLCSVPSTNHLALFLYLLIFFQQITPIMNVTWHFFKHCLYMVTILYIHAKFLNINLEYSKSLTENILKVKDFGWNAFAQQQKVLYAKLKRFFQIMLVRVLHLQVSPHHVSMYSLKLSSYLYYFTFHFNW